MDKEKKEKIVLCPNCKGCGFRTEMNFRGHTEGYERKEVECGRCGGAGRLKKIKQVTYVKLLNDE
jgi:DnaJ-class molecular chaperone